MLVQGSPNLSRKVRPVLSDEVLEKLQFIFPAQRSFVENPEPSDAMRNTPEILNPGANKGNRWSHGILLLGDFPEFLVSFER